MPWPEERSSSGIGVNSSSREHIGYLVECDPTIIFKIRLPDRREVVYREKWFRWRRIFRRKESQSRLVAILNNFVHQILLPTQTLLQEDDEIHHCDQTSLPDQPLGHSNGRAERLLTSVSLSRCLWRRWASWWTLSSPSSRGPWRRWVSQTDDSDRV